MADFVQTIETSLAVGSLYALIALGYTMVYGILRFINFAHGDMVVLGAWLSYTMASWVVKVQPAGTSPPVWLGPVVCLASMAICGAVAFVIEQFAYRPLRKAPRINVLITAIGVSLLLQNVGQLKWMFGTDPVRMPNLLPDVTVWSISFGDAAGKVVKVGLVDVVIFVTAGVLMFALQFLVFRTKIGAAMRAVSFNTETAALMGIPVDRVISMTFVVGAMLAAAAGFLNSMKYPLLNQPAHTQWVLLGLKAFVAAVIGGIGNIRGAVLGGFIIAFVEQFGGFYISSSYRDVYVFGLLILILLVRPSGLLGSTVREKV
jgi:branched-chain amino acid transport system permease protein